MVKGTISRPINQFLRALVGKINVENIYIFGSQSSGTADEESDIDLLVISDDFKNMDEDKRLDILYKASRFISPEIHPWGATSDEIDKASSLTTIGNIRSSGIAFL